MNITDAPLWQRLGPWGWAAAAGAVLVAVLAVVWLLTAPQRAATAKGEARAASAFGQARAQAGHEAVEITGRVAGSDAATDDIHQENRDAITAAPGAGQAVDPRAAGAGRDGLCRYAAYRDRAWCVQHPGARVAPDPGRGG